MILGIIILLVGIVVGILKWIEWGWEESLVTFDITLISAIITSLTSQFVYTVAASYEITNTSQTNIYTLQTATGIDGSFCLGYGSVSSNPHYYFYTKDENGLYQLMDLDSDDVKLNLTDEQEPKLIIYEYTNVGNEWFFGFGKPWSLFTYYKYELVVPTDTIQFNYYNGMLE